MELHLDMADKLTENLRVRMKKQSSRGDKCVAALDWQTRKNKWVMPSLEGQKQSCVHRNLTCQGTSTTLISAQGTSWQGISHPRGP